MTDRVQGLIGFGKARSARFHFSPFRFPTFWSSGLLLHSHLYHTMKTRSAPTNSEKSEDVTKAKTLVAAEKPSKTFILPSPTSDNARLLSLPDPQSGELTRYFFCPNRGIYEFTVVAPPAHMGVVFCSRLARAKPRVRRKERKRNPSPRCRARSRRKQSS